MKTIFAFAALALATGAFAHNHGTGYRSDDQSGALGTTDTRWGDMVNIQSQEARPSDGNRHMIEFNAEAIPSLVYAIEKTKTKGTNSDNDSDTTLGINYAYSIHPNVQVGGRLNYFNGVFANNDVERMDVSAVGWFNLNSDLKNSAFASLSLGTGFAQTFGTNGGRDDLWLAGLSVGKRFSLERFGVNNVSFTPEVALTNQNSTNNSSFDYRQATEFRLIQFSVIW